MGAFMLLLLMVLSLHGDVPKKMAVTHERFHYLWPHIIIVEFFLIWNSKLDAKMQAILT
jgi:hypothetical protein